MLSTAQYAYILMQHCYSYITSKVDPSVVYVYLSIGQSIDPMHITRGISTRNKEEASYLQNSTEPNK